MWHILAITRTIHNIPAEYDSGLNGQDGSVPMRLPVLGVQAADARDKFQTMRMRDNPKRRSSIYGAAGGIVTQHLSVTVPWIMLCHSTTTFSRRGRHQPLRLNASNWQSLSLERFCGRGYDSWRLLICSCPYAPCRPISQSM
jgi:hypothetical protein